MNKSLPIGTDNFRTLRENNKYYVDKTLMIKDFMKYNMEVSLITRPRRFGKTLNMTMMREFFDINRDSKSIFEGLNIMSTACVKQINSTPTIYLTFKNCTGNTLDLLKDGLAKAIRSEYMRFYDIFGHTVDKNSNDYIIFYKTYEALIVGDVSDSFLKSSLSELIKAVHCFYRQKPLVLIDEYDQPFIKAHEMGFRDEFSSLYGGVLGEALKGNEHLGQALLTGIQRVAKESIFSELNNFLVYTVLSEQYSPYFGLTTDETRLLLNDYGVELNDAICSYYDGYLFSQLSMYNPWSILCFLNTLQLRPYWINTSTNSLIRESIKGAERDFMTAFEKLIIDGEVEVSVNLEASFFELASTKTLWGLLVNSGYLTVTEETFYERKVLKIPNQEVKEEFRSIVATYTRLSADTLQELFIALVTQDMKRFLDIYQKLVYEYVSFYDIKENSYHMLLLGMAISMADMYKITSNQEAGDGRPDIVLESLQPELRPHIIFEIKQGDNVETLKQEALAQILNKKYYVKLKGKVLCVGLAHSKKKCELVHHEILHCQ